jgi:archaellum component FlaF (FlaF/FlaG flagellin family)
MISFSQIFVAGRIASKADNWPSDIQKAIEEVRDDVIRDMEDSKVSIKIESSDGDTVDINIRTKGNVVRHLPTRSPSRYAKRASVRGTERW